MPLPLLGGLAKTCMHARGGKIPAAAAHFLNNIPLCLRPLGMSIAGVEHVKTHAGRIPAGVMNWGTYDPLDSLLLGFGNGFVVEVFWVNDGEQVINSRFLDISRG